MKKNKLPRILIKFVFPSLLILASCDRPGDNIGNPIGSDVPTVEYLVIQGWVNYEAGDYTAAKSNFIDAVNKDVFFKDAYSGLGWTLNRMADFNAAISKFNLLLTLASDADVDYKLLSHAGNAMSYSGLNSDSLACLEIEKYLKLNSIDYVFSHDSQVTTDNMKKLLVNGYWNYKNYYQVQRAIIEWFSPTWLSDLIASEDWASEQTDSIAMIMFDFEVDTSSVPYDTTITRAWVDISENSNLIAATSIVDSVSNLYLIQKFVHGKNTIFIDLDSISDPLVLWDDLQQPVIVDYVNVEDYGKYLNTLLAMIITLY